MASPRLFLESDLAPGAAAALDEAQRHYLERVLRLGAGARLRLFNGRDGEFAAELTGGGRQLALQVGPRLRSQPAAPDLRLLFAPLKRQATDWLVEKASELGVSRLQPVLTRRTVAERVRVDRLRLVAREAAEQCERLSLPEIAEAIPLGTALEGWDPQAPLLFADEAGDDAQAPWGGPLGRARPLAEVLEGVRAVQTLAVLIGPEGGFHAEERRWLRGLAFVTPVSLGPRILRAETAGVAALSLAQALWGDWRAPL